MVKNKILSIEVAYAKPEKQVILACEVAAGCTLEEAIKTSGILALFPEIDLKQQAVGVFSEPKELDTIVQDGDRIELYRHLLRDPKETRRLKAKKQAR